MGRLRITGTYTPNRLAAGARSIRAASEHGQGRIGLYVTREGVEAIEVTIHNAEDPGVPVASGSIPMEGAGGDDYTARQTCYLGAGRSIVVISPTSSVYSYFGRPLSLTSVTYRGGAVEVGPMLTMSTGSGGITVDGIVTDSLAHLLVYATSGSSFKMVGQFSMPSGRVTAAADFAIDSRGVITALTAWKSVGVVIGRVGSSGLQEHAPFLVRGGALFTFADRIRRYDAATLALQATSAFGPPADVAEFGYGVRRGFGMPNFGPDGKIAIFEITKRPTSTYPDYIESVRVWRVNPATLERTIVDLDPPHSAGSSASVPEFPESIWNIMFPPVGPGDEYVQPLGDMRSSMGGLLIAFGRSSVGSDRYQSGDSAAGLLDTGEWAVAETVAPPGGAGITNSPGGAYFTRDNYAVSLDPFTKGWNVVFFSTAPVIPLDAVVELGNYKQGFFSSP